jgi:hypothetical protein
MLPGLAANFGSFELESFSLADRVRFGCTLHRQ